MNSKLSRRQLFSRTALAGAMLYLPKSVWAAEPQPLVIPPIIEMGRGKPIRLDLRSTQTQLEKGKIAQVWGVNGHYLAPTVRVRSGDFLKLTYANSLPQAVSMNIQGLLASTEMVGSIHRSLAPNESWSPIVSVNQPACTAWYHANTMLQSAAQVYRGLAGLWIIEDEQSRSSSLPRQYGVNDIPLILQDQTLNSEGEQIFDAHQIPFFGSQLFVNGQIAAYHNVPRGWIRLRILNASLSRPYELRLDNDKSLHLIATGMGMLAQPLEMQQIWLAPSERVEVLIDVSDGKEVALISGQKRGLFDQAKALFSHHQDLQDNVILTLRPEGLASVLNDQPPLPAFNKADFNLQISQERKFTLRPLDYLINRQRFDPKRLDFSVKKGSVERWYLSSNEAVGFTLQGAKFIVETKNRQKMPYKALAWQDTVWLEKEVETTILVRFEHTASEAKPFTFGVSDFTLRDKGAMGQFAVVD